MNKIEWFWNMMYYTVYLADLKASYVFKYINPVYWINKIPKVKKHHSKQGISDMNDFMIGVFNDPKNGDSSIIAGGTMGGIVIFIEVGILNIIGVLFDIPLYNKQWSSTNAILALLALIIPVWFINRTLLFKNDKYLKYFEEFKKLPVTKRRNYIKLASFVILIIVLLFVLSFKLFN